MDEWDELLNRLEILGGRRKKRVATEETIQAFEDRRSLRLPASYRRFATLFGAGELAGYYRFCVPLDRKDSYDLATDDYETHGQPYDGVWDDYVPIGTLRNVLFFGATIGGEPYAWRTDEPVGKGARLEYKIYRFNRRGPAQPVATSFSDFVHECLDGTLDESEEPIPQTFLRY